MNDSEILEIINELKKFDKNAEQHLKDLLLLAKKLPNQYTLATFSLKSKVAKFKK